MPQLKHLIVFLFFLFVSKTYLFGNENELLRLNEKVFGTANAALDIKINLANGISCFFFEIEQTGNTFNFISKAENRILSTVLINLKSHFSKTKPDNIKLLFTGDYNEKEFESYLINIDSSVFEIATSEHIESVYEETRNEAKILCFLSNTLTYLSDSIRVEEKYQGRFTENPAGKMVLFKSNEDNLDSLKSLATNTWKSTGRIPNFIILAPNETAKTLDLCRWLNKQRRFRGKVKYQGRVLNEIYWKQMPGTVTPGQFSFPIMDYSLVLSPYKNGYLITPGEIIHHRNMKDVIRPFIAFDSRFPDGLNYHFQFEKDANNEVSPNKVNSIQNGSKWIWDDSRGNVVLFDSLNSYIDYSKPNQINFNTPFSISIWLKPQQQDPFMGIIGVGTSFSFKLRDGKPDFTTAQIQDHIDKTKLAINQWTHVGFVFNPGSTIEFYVNGRKSSILQASEIHDSEQSLVIGNNIWGEQYFGCMDELMIWDRGLSELEFEKLYIQQQHASKAGNYWLFLLIPIVIVFTLFFKRRKSKLVRKERADSTLYFRPNHSILKNENKIQVFGQLNIVSKELGNVTKSFSPLLKQLLAFFILKTVFSEHDGVSTKEINDVFWPGFSKEQAKDNRGTNIKKLRKALNQVPGIQIVFKDKKWFIEVSGKTNIDLYKYKDLKNKINTELEDGAVSKISVELLINLLNQGNILQDLDAEWLDSFKGKCTEEVTLLLSRISISSNHNASRNTEVAKTMLLFDNLNEDALGLLIQNQIESGNHGLAKQAYEEFSKRYETLYSEKFPLSFNEIQKHTDT